MAKEPKAGDRVTWNSPQGRVTGRVKKKVTGTAKVKGHVARATPEAPQYLVESEKTGAEALHKADALKKA